MGCDVIVHRIVKQKKSKNTYIEKHKHKFFHYIYTLSGTARIIVNEEEIIASSKKLIMMPPNTPHEIYGIDEFLSIDVKFQCNSNFSYQLNLIPYHSAKMNDYIDAQFKEILHEGIKKHFFYQDIINTKMTEILLYILRNAKESHKNMLQTEYNEQLYWYRENLEIQNIIPAIKYIDEHIHDPLKIKDLASLCGYTSNYFSTTFKNCMGLSPIKYIHTKKITLAKSLLISGDLNITQISEKLGFDNIHYFSRIFKKIIGITPKMYLDRSKMKLDIGLNIINSSYTPINEYEIPLKNIAPHDKYKNTKPTISKGLSRLYI